MSQRIKILIGLAVFVGAVAFAFSVVDDKIDDLNQAQDDIAHLTKLNSKIAAENRRGICETAALVGDFPREPLPGETEQELAVRFSHYESFKRKAEDLDCRVILQRSGFEPKPDDPVQGNVPENPSSSSQNIPNGNTVPAPAPVAPTAPAPAPVPAPPVDPGPDPGGGGFGDIGDMIDDLLNDTLNDTRDTVDGVTCGLRANC